MGILSQVVREKKFAPAPGNSKMSGDFPKAK
jgi:hypothetical protein